MPFIDIAERKAMEKGMERMEKGLASRGHARHRGA